MLARPYEPEDFSEIAKFHVMEFGAIGETPEALLKELSEPQTECLVFTDAGSVAGFVHYYRREPEIFLNWIVLSPALRGKGEGSRWLKEFLATNRKVGIASVSLVTRNRYAKALCLYLANGFQIRGTYVNARDNDLMIELRKAL